MSKRFLLFFFSFSCVLVVFTSLRLPQEDSEMTLLMRKMADEMKNVKASTLSDKFYTDWVVDYKLITVAAPSTEAKKGPKFDEYSKIFLAQVDRFRSNKEVSLIRPQYNLLISGCIQCHETFCPGPLSMLKKLKVPEN
jgi:hypothetical protein